MGSCARWSKPSRTWRCARICCGTWRAGSGIWRAEMAAAPLRSIEPGARFDPRRLRREFPIFERNPGLVFLDSGASAQKPRQVIDGIAEFYRTDYANVHRGVYKLSARSTDHFEEGREKTRAFL